MIAKGQILKWSPAASRSSPILTSHKHHEFFVAPA
jgi:hypothetical protein